MRLVDLKDPAELFTQSLEGRKTLAKAAAILKGGAVRLRLKRMGHESVQLLSNSELPQTHKCPADTIKTPMENVTRGTQSTTTKMWV